MNIELPSPFLLWKYVINESENKVTNSEIENKGILRLHPTFQTMLRAYLKPKVQYW